MMRGQNADAVAPRIGCSTSWSGPVALIDVVYPLTIIFMMSININIRFPRLPNGRDQRTGRHFNRTK